jgi:DNA helicase-2/ATP-dependent DNA helicase PcrA
METVPKPSYLDQLNDVQRAAVTTINGPIMVIAGPGSGKTRVITFRIAHLIESGIPPWNLLALTFTNKAAKEMKERIELTVGQAVHKVWAGTFHSMFSRILRMHAEKLGFPNSFSIYDTQDSKSLITAIIKEMSFDPKVYSTGAVFSRISSAKSSLITPKAYEKNEELMAQDSMNRQPYLYKIYETYYNRCRKAGAMDFDDLLLNMFRLLYENKDGVKDQLRKRFPYVLVDEFQDTNFLQYAILKQLSLYPESPQNVCIVGDDAQSIYAFRGATIQNILQFEKDFSDVKIFKLEQNYRSTPHIIEAANQIIINNTGQIKKKIWTDIEEGKKIKVLKAVTDSEEGRKVAETILEYKNRYHFPNAEIAILYRTNAQSRIFEEHLRRNNIPYRIYSGISFYQRKEVKDVMAYLRFSCNIRDEEAFRRIINFPRRGLGNKTVSSIIDYHNEKEISLIESIQTTPLAGRARNGVDKFLQVINSFQKHIKEKNAYDASLAIYKESGLFDLYSSDTSLEGVGKLENINSLLDGIKEFTENDELIGDSGPDEDKSLPAYLQQIALHTEQDEDDENPDKLVLMSVHAAKGLEYKAVFVTGMEENLFPSWLSIDSQDDLEEERRLFYVAITRAKEALCLSYSGSRYQYGQMRYYQPSRFLSEIPEIHMESTVDISERKVSTFSRVSGNFSRKPALPNHKIKPEDFNPSAPHLITAGMKVLHLKFGQGKVLEIDGNRDNRIATIYFEEIDNPKRRIMLRFAKLQVL